MITGESRPVLRTQGDRVVAGTVSTDAALRIKVTAIGEDTALAGIGRLVAAAQDTKSKAQALADRFAGTAVLRGPRRCRNHLHRMGLGRTNGSRNYQHRYLLGALALEDGIRPEAAEAVSELNKLGIRTFMITGDAVGGRFCWSAVRHC